MIKLVGTPQIISSKSICKQAQVNLDNRRPTNPGHSKAPVQLKPKARRYSQTAAINVTLAHQKADKTESGQCQLESIDRKLISLNSTNFEDCHRRKINYDISPDSEETLLIRKDNSIMEILMIRQCFSHPLGRSQAQGQDDIKKLRPQKRTYSPISKLTTLDTLIIPTQPVGIRIK